MTHCSTRWCASSICVKICGLVYAKLGLDPTRTAVAYCLAGWRASVARLTLTWLGFEDVRVYDSSWLEWGAGGRFPIEVGDV